MNSEQREPSFSLPSALALSNMEEGMGHNIERAQALQEDMVQRRASLNHHSPEAQALQGQEDLLADIIEEEMAHGTQVSVLLHLHLQQAKEIKSQSEEIRHVSTLLEKQPKEVQQQHMPLEFHRIFQSLAGPNLKMNWPRKPHGMCTNIHDMCTLIPTLRGFTSTPLRHPGEGRSKARVNTEVYPPGYDMKVAVQEFCKLHEPKINKLKGGYSATANLIFQSWLKDINVHIEDQNLTEREAIQLVKDFTAERACNEVEFYGHDHG